MPKKHIFFTKVSHSLVFPKGNLTLDTFCYDDHILKMFASRDIGQFVIWARGQP